MYKILSKLVDECWRYSKPNQCHFWAWLRRPIFGVLDSQGSAETLVRRGGITNYHLIAYLFSNISAKNYQNWLMYIEVIAYNVIVVFWDDFTSLCKHVRLSCAFIINLLIYLRLWRPFLTCGNCDHTVQQQVEIGIRQDNSVSWLLAFRSRPRSGS